MNIAKFGEVLEVTSSRGDSLPFNMYTAKTTLEQLWDKSQTVLEWLRHRPIDHLWKGLTLILIHLQTNSKNLYTGGRNGNFIHEQWNLQGCKQSRGLSFFSLKPLYILVQCVRTAYPGQPTLNTCTPSSDCRPMLWASFPPLILAMSTAVMYQWSGSIMIASVFSNLPAKTATRDSMRNLSGIIILKDTEYQKLRHHSKGSAVTTCVYVGFFFFLGGGFIHLCIITLTCFQPQQRSIHHHNSWY